MSLLDLSEQEIVRRNSLDELRKMGIYRGFKVVYSEELPDRGAIVECEGRNKKSMVGTVSYIPAVFGCACAQAAIEFFRDFD